MFAGLIRARQYQDQRADQALRNQLMQASLSQAPEQLRALQLGNQQAEANIGEFQANAPARQMQRDATMREIAMGMAANDALQFGALRPETKQKIAPYLQGLENIGYDHNARQGFVSRADGQSMIIPEADLYAWANRMQALLAGAQVEQARAGTERTREDTRGAAQQRKYREKANPLQLEMLRNEASLSGQTLAPRAMLAFESAEAARLRNVEDATNAPLRHEALKLGLGRGQYDLEQAQIMGPLEARRAELTNEDLEATAGLGRGTVAAIQGLYDELGLIEKRQQFIQEEALNASEGSRYKNSLLFPGGGSKVTAGQIIRGIGLNVVPQRDSKGALQVDAAALSKRPEIAQWVQAMERLEQEKDVIHEKLRALNIGARGRGDSVAPMPPRLAALVAAGGLAPDVLNKIETARRDPNRTAAEKAADLEEIASRLMPPAKYK